MCYCIRKDIKLNCRTKTKWDERRRQKKNEWKWNWMIWLIFKYVNFYCIPIAPKNNKQHHHRRRRRCHSYYIHVWHFDITFIQYTLMKICVKFNGLQNATFLWHIRLKKMHANFYIAQCQMVKWMLLSYRWISSSFCSQWKSTTQIRLGNKI